MQNWYNFGMDENIKIKNENNETIKAGCVVVDENKVLLISDKEGKIWTFPKGHSENGETLEQVALRETEEETGYKVEIIKRLSDLTYKHGQTGENIRVAMFQAKPLEETGIKEEKTQSKWFSIDEAKEFLYYNLKSYLAEIGLIQF